jgi:hypothetical protein
MIGDRFLPAQCLTVALLVGTSLGVTAPSSHGQTWARYENRVNHDHATGIATDSQGNAYVVGRLSTLNDMWLVKYSPVGVKLWALNFNADSSDDVPLAITVDANDNVYVAGYTLRDSNSFLTWKISSSGQEQWRRFFSGGADPRASAINVDAAGNVYVSGATEPAGFNNAMTTIKYSSAGTLLWVKHVYADSREDPDYFELPNSLKLNSGRVDAAIYQAIDPAGNVYVTGRARVSGDFYVYLKKYLPDGTTAWFRTYKTPGSHIFVEGLTVDSDGNPSFIAGRTGGSIITTRYNPTGALLWSRVRSAVALAPEVRDIRSDAAGNVYELISDSVDGSSRNQMVLTRYAPDGTQTWQRTYRPLFNRSLRNVYAEKLAIDPFGNIIVALRVVSGTREFDIGVVVYSPDGQILWDNLHDGGLSRRDEIGDITCDAFGNVFVAVSSSRSADSNNGGTLTDIGVLKYEYARRNVIGTITLQGLSALSPGRDVTLQFRPLNGTTILERTVTVNANGAYTATGIPAGNFTVSAKGIPYLRRTPGTISGSGNINSASFSLLVGDVNNDNVINIADFNLLRRAFGSVTASPNYSRNADLNDDGIINIADFNRLRANFGLSGDM